MTIVQADNVLIGVPSFSSYAEIESSTGWLANRPASNVLRMLPSDRARTSDVTGTKSFVLDRGESVSIPSAYAALLYTNASSTATWRYRRATGYPLTGGNTVYDSGAGGITLWASPNIGYSALDRRHSFLKVEDSDSYRYEQIDIDDASNPDGHLRVGRFHSGEIFQPAQGARQYGSEVVRWVEDTQIRTMPGGQHVVRSRRGGRQANFTMHVWDKAEAIADLQRILETLGAHRDCLVVFEPNDDTYRYFGMIPGLLSSGTPIEAVVNSLWRIPMTVKELI